MSSIPLAALDVRPIAQPESPLDQYAKVAQLKSLAQGQQVQQQSLQSGQIQIQQQKQALADQQAMTKSMQDWDGKDINELPSLVLKNGGSANAVFGLKSQLLKQQQDLATLTKDQLANKASQNDMLLGKLQSVTDGPDEGLGERLTAATQDAVQSGLVDPAHAQQVLQLAGQDPKAIRSTLSLFEKSLMGQKTQFDQAQEAAKTKTAQEQANIEQQRLTATLPGGALEDPENKFLRLDAARQQGNPLSAEDQAFLKSYKANKTMVPSFNLDMGGGLTPDALDQAAMQYLKTGQLPSVGYGATGTVLRENIANRAAQLAKENPELADLTSNKANFAANENSLKNVQKQFDQVNAFESTAGKNLDLFLTTAKGLVDSGSPLVNTPLRYLNDKLVGSQNMAAFNAARTTALTEIAKVLNSSNASGVLSDSARNEVSQLIGKDATLGQIYKAAGILKQDMQNRHDAYQQQISDIQGRLGNKPPKPETPKVLTQAQLERAAKDHGVSVDEAKRQAQSQGYTIQ